MKLALNSSLQFIRRPVVQKISSALFTQGMLSVTNLIVGITIAKYAVKSEYGIYVIMFSILGITGNFQNALINDPLTVLAPKKNPIEKNVFLSGLGYGQWLIFVPLIMFSVLALSVYSYVFQDFSLMKYVIPIFFAMSAYIFREFIRTVNYSMLRINVLVKMDTIFVLIIAVGMYVLITIDNITSSSSITILGIGYLLAAILGNIFSRETYKINWKSMKSALHETWKYSRWALVGITSSILKNRSYIYIVTAILGLEKIAEISAARLFLMPIGLFVASTNKITLAQGADILSNKGMDRFKKLILSISFFLIFVWIIYVVFLWVVHGYIISFLGDKYKGIEIFILLWGIFFLVNTLRFPVQNALLVIKDFKVLAKYDVIGAVITVIACLVLTKSLAGYGTIISLIAGDFVLLCFITLRLSKLFNGNEVRS